MSKNTQLGNLVNGIYVDSTGKVGVGTQSPTTKLDIQETTANTYATINVRGNNRGGGIDMYNGSTWLAQMYADTSSNIIFANGASFTERMRITSGGNVGIGTSTPNVSSQDGAKKVLTVQGGSGQWGGVEVSADTSSGGALLGFYGFTSPQISGGLASYIGSWLENSGSGAGSTMRFFTRQSAVGLDERMRITGNGIVLIGLTSASSVAGANSLQVGKEIISVGTSSFVGFQNRSSTNFFGFYGSTNILVYNQDVGNIGQFAYSNGAYTALSDINKKKDFEKSNIGLNEVLQLKPTLYRMKTDDESSAKELGFIAQEVKELIPQAYVENESQDDVFIGLNQMPIIAALTKAIQEQQTQINELKALLNA